MSLYFLIFVLEHTLPFFFLFACARNTLVNFILRPIYTRLRSFLFQWWSIRTFSSSFSTRNPTLQYNGYFSSRNLYMYAILFLYSFRSLLFIYSLSVFRTISWCLSSITTSLPSKLIASYVSLLSMIIHPWCCLLASMLWTDVDFVVVVNYSKILCFVSGRGWKTILSSQFIYTFL